LKTLKPKEQKTAQKIKNVLCKCDLDFNFAPIKGSKLFIKKKKFKFVVAYQCPVPSAHAGRRKRGRGRTMSTKGDMSVGLFPVFLYHGSHRPSEWMIEHQNLMIPELLVKEFAQKNLTTLSH
jgi:hypothetical protein